MRVRAIFCSVQDIGKLVKKTKKHFVWKFTINSRDHILELFVSVLSGKKKMKLNGKVVFEGQKVLSTKFTYTLEVENNTLYIDQNGDKFELLINNQPFTHLYSDGQGRDFDDLTAPSSLSEWSSKATGRSVKTNSLRANVQKEERENYTNKQNYSGYNASREEKVNDWDDVKKATINRSKPFEDNSRYSEDVQSDTFSNYKNQYSEYYRGNNPKSKTYVPSKTENIDVRQSNTPNNSRMFVGYQFDKENGSNGFANFENPNGPRSCDSKQNNFSFNPKIPKAVSPTIQGPSSSQIQNKSKFFEQDQTEERRIPDTSPIIRHQSFFVFEGTNETVSQQMPKLSPEPSPQQQMPQRQANIQQRQPTNNTTDDLLDLATHEETLTNNINDLYKMIPQPQVPLKELTVDTNTVLPEEGKEQGKKDLWQTNLVRLDANEVEVQKNFSPMLGMNNQNFGFGNPQTMQNVTNYNMYNGGYGMNDQNSKKIKLDSNKNYYLQIH